MQLRRRLARGAAWSAAATWSRIGISFATFAVLATLLGPEIFGLAAMVTSVVALLEVFLGIGILESLVQRRALEPEHANSMFWVLLGAGAVLALLASLAAPAVAAYYDAPLLEALIPWAMLTPLLWASCSVPHALLRRDLHFRPLALATTAAEIGGSGVGISMALAGWGVWSLIGIEVGHAAVRAVVLWSAAGWRPTGFVSHRHLNELAGFNASLVASRLFAYLDRAVPALIVGPILGPAALGGFSIARRFVQLMAELVLNPLQAIALPGFARLVDEPQRIRELFAQLSRTGGAIALPAFAGVMLTAGEFVPLLLGEHWVEAVIPLQVLCWLGIRNASSTFGHSLLRGLGRPQLHTLVAGLATALGAAAMLAVAPRGTGAVAAAAVAAGVATWPLGALAVRRLSGLGLRAQLAPFAAPALATLIMAAAVLAWRSLPSAPPPPVWNLFSSVSLGVLAYSAALLLLARGTVREVVQIVAELRPGR